MPKPHLSKSGDNSLNDTMLVYAWNTCTQHLTFSLSSPIYVQAWYSFSHFHTTLLYMRYPQEAHMWLAFGYSKLFLSKTMSLWWALYQHNHPPSIVKQYPQITQYFSVVQVTNKFKLCFKNMYILGPCRLQYLKIKN